MHDSNHTRFTFVLDNKRKPKFPVGTSSPWEHKLERDWHKSATLCPQSGQNSCHVLGTSQSCGILYRGHQNRRIANCIWYLVRSLRKRTSGEESSRTRFLMALSIQYSFLIMTSCVISGLEKLRYSLQVPHNDFFFFLWLANRRVNRVDEQK